MPTQASDRGVLFTRYTKGHPAPWSWIQNVNPIAMHIRDREVPVRFLLTIAIEEHAPLDTVQIVVDDVDVSAKQKVIDCLVRETGSQDWATRAKSDIHARLAAGLRALARDDVRLIDAVTMSEGHVEFLLLDATVSQVSASVVGAITRGELPGVRDALSHGVSPNAIDDGGIPLIQMPITGRKLAVDEGRPAAGHLHVLSLLIENGADLNASDPKGWTAVHTACFCNDREALALLLKAGADAGARDGQGWTGVHYAAVHGHRQILDAVLASGVDVNATSASGNTPLRIAVEGGQREIARALLERGADPNLADHKGIAPVHAAALRDDAEVVRLLIRHGANPSIRTTSSPRATALHIAASRGAEAIVKALLDGGADTHITDDAGNTAADVARTYQQDQTASLLAAWKGRPTSWFGRLFRDGKAK